MVSADPAGDHVEGSAFKWQRLNVANPELDVVLASLARQSCRRRHHLWRDIDTDDRGSMHCAGQAGMACPATQV